MVVNHGDLPGYKVKNHPKNTSKLMINLYFCREGAKLYLEGEGVYFIYIHLPLAMPKHWKISGKREG